MMQPTSPTTAVKGRRSLERLAPFIAAGTAFVVGVAAFRPYPVGIYMDDGVYVILAKAIATGKGLRNLHLPGAPFATHFPPGFPLLLAALWRMNPNFPQNIQLFLLLQAVLLGAVALGTYQFGRRILGWQPPISLPVALAATLSLPLMSLGAVMYSEMLALALLMAFLVIAEPRVRNRLSGRDALLLGAYAGVIGLVRVQVAIVLVPAVCGILMFGRQWRAILVFAAAALCLLVPWQAWTAVHDSGLQGLLRGYYGSYGAWFAAGLRAEGAHLVTTTLRLNAGEIAGTIADRVAPWRIGNWRIIPVLVATAAVISGAFKTWNRASITVLFAAGYVAFVFVWPWLPYRFIWGQWPIFLVLGVSGARQAIESARASSSPRLAYVPVFASAALVVGMIRAEMSTYRSRAWSTPLQRQVQYITPLVQWVKDNTRPKDVVIADDEPLVYLFTGRQAMPPLPYTAEEYVRARTRRKESQALGDLLARYPAHYIVTVVPSTRDAVRGLAQRDSSHVRELTELPNGAAFEVR